MATPRATQGEFARLISHGAAEGHGLSQPAVHKLISKGVLSQGGTLADWLVQYARHMRDLAAGWKSEEGFDLVHERARLSRRQSEKLEIDIAAKRGELIPTRAVADAINFSNVTIRSRLLALPSRFKSLRPALSAKDVDVLDSLVREILTELSNARFPADIAEHTRQYFSDLHAAAEAKTQRVGGPPPNPQPGE